MSVETAPGTLAKPNGTEYLITVEGDTTEVTLFDGEAELSNGVDKKTIHTGYQGTARPGQDIQIRTILKAKNISQWWIYYPAVLDPTEIEHGLAPAEKTQFGASLASYRAGDLQAALTNCPGYPNVTPVEPTSEAQRTYLAGLYLAVGAVDHTEAQLTNVSTNASLAIALRTMIAAVALPLEGQRADRKQKAESEDQMSSSELLALSYTHQSTNGLKEALRAARLAVEQSRDFGFGLARVAELEFSFGHTHAAREAVTHALRVTPRNAQARALNGFLLAAENHTKEALAEFEEAIRIDPALGNAWLGRGLCKRRLGWWNSAGVSPRNSEGNGGAAPQPSGTPAPHSRAVESQELKDWLADLQTAAILEPTRSLVRSYAGKAFAEIGETRLAEKELNFARELDPNDPTPWLYSALLKQQQNQINKAIDDLESSQDRNDNRALFRSNLRLDEDRAVRSANLASIYRDAGMTEVSVREAARAVTYDYANDSAHLFLSDSYNELRDPTRFNLRYETIWFNELLLANLLAPIGAGRLSQHVSQQEYSALFEANRLGIASSTLTRSDGRVEQLASQFGTIGRTSYALDLDYQHNFGVRQNNDLDSIEWYTTLKHQFTPQDAGLLLIKYEDYHSGDNFQYYDPHASLRPNFRFDEYQHPIIVGGWHHEWSPGSHTLLLGGRLENYQRFSDRAARQLLLIPTQPYSPSEFVPFDADYHGQLEIYTAEINQIFQLHWLTLSAGARYQSGTFDTTAQLFNPARLINFFDQRATNAIATHEDFERVTGYGYLTVTPIERLWLTAGLSYDDITYPANFRQPPISSGQDHRNQLGPKASLVWQPVPQATVRGMFTRSLGGVSLDESYRLEPTQLAGFPQAFRSLISESAVGSVAAPKYNTFGLGLDLKFPTGTYAGIQAERLETDVRRKIGVFVPVAVAGPSFIPQFIPSTTDEQLDYRENAIALTLNQLVGEQLVLGANYRFTEAKLHDMLPGVPVSALSTADQTKRSNLHQASGYILFNGSSGFFARAETRWYDQHNSGYSPALPDGDFFQENLFAGYRFARRHAELRLGLLNLTGQNYHLNPLTVYEELPRERVFEARLSFLF